MEGLKCPICCDLYDADNKLPKQIRECGHTICFECISAIFNRSVYCETPSCPICRTNVNYTHSKCSWEIEHCFSTNYIILKVLGYPEEKSVKNEEDYVLKIKNEINNLKSNNNGQRHFGRSFSETGQPINKSKGKSFWNCDSFIDFNATLNNSHNKNIITSHSIKKNDKKQFKSIEDIIVNKKENNSILNKERKKINEEIIFLKKWIEKCQPNNSLNDNVLLCKTTDDFKQLCKKIKTIKSENREKLYEERFKRLAPILNQPIPLLDNLEGLVSNLSKSCI